MASIQEIVDGIRGYIAAGARAPTETTIAYAEPYAQACIEANSRLRKCDEAMQRGLRTDAIHFAESEPNLLDRITLLDFPELSAWKDACVTNGMTSPPELLIQLASTLNEAYASDLPLKELMANHRIMALARAPLDKRLTIMRRIAELDSTNTFWDDDVRTFEQSRVDEMREILGRAVKVSDARTIARLREEADKPEWRISFPQDLRASLTEYNTRLESGKTIAALREMLPLLNEAYGAMAYDECRALLLRWSSLTGSASLQIPVDLKEQVDPIFAWTSEATERRERSTAFEQACVALQQSLDQKRSPPVLRQAHFMVRSFGLDISEELEARYRGALAEHDAEIQNRRKMVYAGIAATLAIVTGVISFIAYRHFRENEIADAKIVLNQAMNDVQQGELTKAMNAKKEMVAQHPHVMDDAGIESQVRQLDSEVADEQKRQSDFDHIWQVLNTGTPDQVSNNDLQQAANLASTVAERAKVETLKNSIEMTHLRKQHDIDLEFEKECANIRLALTQSLPSELMSTNPDEFRKQLDQINSKVEHLRQQPNVNSRDREQLTQLDGTIQSRRRDLDDQIRRDTALAAVLKFGSSVKQHNSALQQFIRDCPDDSRCGDFKLACDRMNSNLAVERWATMAARWSAQMIPAQSSEADKRVKAIQDYLTENTGSPMADQATEYQACLQLAIDTVKEDGPWKDVHIGSFNRFLSHKFWPLYYLESEDKKICYYVKNGDVQPIAKLAPNGTIKYYEFDSVVDSADSSSLQRCRAFTL